MLRTTLLTATCALLIGGSAFAQTPAPDAGAPAQTELPASTKDLFAAPAGTDANAVGSIQPKDGQQLVTSLIGESVYESEKSDAANIGKVNDFNLTPDGKIEAVVVGVGGFLGVGSKDVAVSPAKLKQATRSDGKTWLVLTATKDELNSAPAFDKTKLAPGIMSPGTTTGESTTQPAAPAQ